MDQMMKDKVVQNECTFGESHNALESSMRSGTSLELLEQHQAKEQARLLHRFKELREWQQQQQQQLMMQQQQQLTNLQYEQNKVQTILAANQHSGGRALRPNAARSKSPVMTPPCKPRPGALTNGVRGNKDFVGHSTTAGISMDSGLVSMQDTLKSQSSLPKPIMYIDPSQSSNLPEEDKYTNSELFSNPGSRDDEDEEFVIAKDNGDRGPPAPDWMSDTSENFIPLKLPPPRPMRGSVANNVVLKQGKDKTTADQLAGLEQLLSTAPAGLLQKMLTLLPKTSDSISSDVHPINRIVENSASPTLIGPTPSIHQQQHNLQHPLLQQHNHHRPQPSLEHTYERQNTQFALHPDANFYQTMPSEKELKSVNVHDMIQMGLQGFSEDHNSQYVPRAVLMREDYGAHGRNEEEDEGVEEDDDEVDEEDEDCEDDDDQEDTSQNITAKEVKVDEDDDDRPIQGTGGTKSFEKLLEEQLREEEEEEKRRQAQSGNATVPHRPFLRKGEGIARFNSAPKKKPPKRQEKRSSGGVGRTLERDSALKAPVDKGKSCHSDKRNKDRNSVGARLKSLATRKVSAKDAKYNAKASKSDVGEGNSPLSAPAKLTLIRTAASRKLDEQRNKQWDEGQGGDEMIHNGISCDLNVDQSPSSAKCSDDHDSTELDSLAEFELLEDVADNMSFCSNSSLVRKLVCSDAKDHQEAVKKLQTITESRKQQVAEKSSNPTSLNQFRSNGTSSKEGINQQEILNPKTNDNNDNNNNSNSNNVYTKNNSSINHNCGSIGTNTKNKIDSIILAKPADISSSSDVTLTDSSSSGDEADEREEKTSHKTKFNNEFTSGYFSQPGSNILQTNHTSSSQPSTLFQGSSSSLLNSVIPTIPPTSPSKPIPRKVASMTTKVNSANDTLSMLQALSMKAGLMFTDTDAKKNSVPSDRTNSEFPSYSMGTLGTKFDKGLSVNGVAMESALGGEGLNHANGQMNGNLEAVLHDQRAKVKEYNSRHYGINGADDNDISYEDSDDDDNDNENISDDEFEKRQICESDKRPLETLSNVMLPSEHEPWAPSAVEGQEKVGATNGFDDEAEWFDDGDDDNDDEDENNPLTNRTPSTVTTGLEPSTPPTSKLVTKLFPKLKPPVTKQVTQMNQPSHTSESTNHGVPVDGVTNRVLRDKLMELETEIERFRSENSNLDRLRREREEGLAKLKQQIETFEKEKEAELKRLEEFKMEEMKKLKRERKLFDTYQKNVRSMPDKKEREEIDNLKAQLEEVQDELKRKESRWTATVSRLKNRLAETEYENGELKEEVRILEKKRLEWLTAQSQGKTLSSSSSSSSLSSHGKSGIDSKPQIQGPSSTTTKPRCSTPTAIEEEAKTVLAVSTGGKKSGTAKMTNAPISLRTSVPAVTSSSATSKTRLTQGQPKATGKSFKSSVGTNDIVSIPPAQQTVRTSGESLPMQKTSVPVMMEITPFAQAASNQSVPASTAVGTLAASSISPSSSFDKSAAMLAMEKAVIDKGNPMEFVENVHSDGKVEKLYKNGAKEVKFPNGTIKEITSDGQTIVCRLANGDIRQIFPDHRVVYIFAEAQIMQTTFPDGLETFQFKNGQVERRYPDSTVEITFPSKDIKYIFPDGGQEVRLTDGTVMSYSSEGERTVEYPSGDREVHTADYQRREFPDGIVKTIYSDGRHETRFPNGRVRMRDKAGNVIMDQMCYR